ncbi:hypothetical protein Ade02nite_85440 [Paractinoplanes deccanensis]|uniref:Lipoprotein n=1 Tax=Paractinoplanes deccanensis TaxID=113561 RepID=A0ABQ3YIS4_9ACTN|nr:hypothetical protein Ade02nite_85440 [Actinoplanes deccanensis]
MAGLALGAILLAGGCGSDDSGNSSSGTQTSAAPVATTTTAAAAGPAEELQAAYAKFADTPVKFKLTSIGGIGGTGAIDAKARTSEFTTDMGSSGSMLTRQVGNDLYVKAEGQLASAVGGAEGKWMHIDVSHVPDSSPISAKNTDPAGTAKLITTASGLTKTGEHAFKGTVDVTKSPSMNAAALKALGAKAKAVPFTAETDDQGNLTKFSMNLESIAPGAGETTATYSDWGAPVDVQAPPAAEVVDMPAKFRKAMGA